jgi:hypothetical protein
MTSPLPRESKRRLALAIGGWRVRREGYKRAELAHQFWDPICRWLVK